jgi:hypothetical protein
MVLSAAQTEAFFEDGDQMGLPPGTRAQLAAEGITAVIDLAEFDKETIEQIASNLRNPGGRIPNPDPAAEAGATIARPPFIFGARSKMRVLAACDLMSFYETINRDLKATSIMWNPVMKNFVQQWNALEERRKDSNLEVPKISKTLTVIKWSEAFYDHLNRKIGVRKIPLAYVTRPVVAVSMTCPARALNMPHTATHGSVEADLVARASHNHPLYRDDNAEVYYDLEEATRGTSYAASIKPYQRAKDGRGALLSIIGQYAGEDKWEAEYKKQDELLHTRVWKGQSNFSLEKYIAQHRNAFISMQQCVEHIPRQLPNERTRVVYLLDGIQCSDAELQASMALVRNDTAVTGKINDFEATASFLLPSCPIAKKRRTQGGGKRVSADISDTLANVHFDDGEAEISEVKANPRGKKISKGKTGVEFRFYKSKEFGDLQKDQVTELLEWRTKNKTKSPGKRGDKVAKQSGTPAQHKKWIAAAVAKQYKESIEATKEDDGLRDYLKGVISEMNGTSQDKVTISASEKKPNAQRVTLASILKKAKHG